MLHKKNILYYRGANQMPEDEIKSASIGSTMQGTQEFEIFPYISYGEAFLSFGP